MNAPQEWLEALVREAEALRAELETGASGPESRGRIRDRLVALGREIDRRIRALEELRDALRPVASRYRAVYRHAPSGTRRFDHLGAAAHRERGWSALTAGEYGEAIVALRTALELDPRDARTQAMLGWAFAGAGDADRAAAILYDLLGEEGGAPLGHLALGYLHLRGGRSADAVRHLEVAASGAEDPTAVLYAHLYLGVAHADQGAFRESRRLLGRALELGPNLTEAYWELGRCHLREGRRDLALEAWRAGGENRFSAWGERCKTAAARLEEGAPSEPF